MSKCQSLSTFSSENLSVSDGEEGNTTDHSHSGTPDVVSTNTDERLDDKSDDLLSQGSEIPADPSDPTQLGSDGLSEKEAILRQVKTQLASNDHNYEVGCGVWIKKENLIYIGWYYRGQRGIDSGQNLLL